MPTMPMALHRSSGFTIIELLVVIMITVAVSLLFLGLDFHEENADAERAAFAQEVANFISSVRIDSLVGKGVPTAGTIVVPDEVRVRVRTGSVAVVYYSGGTIIGTGQTMAYPFRNNPEFQIGSLRITDRDQSVTDVPAANFDVVYTKNDVSFTGADTELATAISAEIAVGYRGWYRTISIDRRANRVDVLAPASPDTVFADR